MEEPGVIYLIWNTVNGKRYVGQTTQPLEARMTQHKSDDLYVDRAIKKYGIENFRYGVIKTCYSKAERDYWERYYIVVLKSKAPYGYNLTDGGEGGTGYTQETLDRMSEAQRGEKNHFYGKHHTEETKAILREKNLGKRCGEDSYWFGKNMPAESTVKMADAKRADTPYQNLLNEMLERQLSYSAFARLVGMSQASLSMKMLVKRPFMDSDVDKFVAFFGKPAEYLFARTDGLPTVFASKTDKRNGFLGRHHTDENRMTFSENNRGDSPYKNLLAEMLKRNISYRNLAVLIGISQANLSRKMLGERLFTRKDIAKLVEIFGMPAEYLLARDDGQIMVPSNRGKTPFKNLAKELQQQNISYTDLGKLLGLSHESISEKMRCKKNFTDAQWQKLSEILGKPAEYLMQRDDG